MGFSSFRELHPTTRRLLKARALRSIGQGALVVDFALYLRALHWTGFSIGLVLGASGLLSAVLSLFLGMSSDRIRRKPFLLAYEIVSLFCCIGALLSAEPVLLTAAAVIGAFGRGAMGAAGPFAPVEQAWLAEEVAAHKRGWVYSLNAAMGFFGMALGALIAFLPWRGLLEGALVYRPLFALVALTAAANLFLIGRAHESYRGSAPAPESAKPAAANIRRGENRILTKLVCINSLYGMTVGLTGPLMSYWFARRFGIGPLEIAPVMALTFVITGVASLITGTLTGTIGIVRSVVWGRLGALVLLVLLPLMPTYWLAAPIYLLRSVLARSGAGAQQALTIGLVRNERRGLAASLNTVSFQVPRSIGPAIAGYLFQYDWFSMPFFAGALFQSVYLALYKKTFRAYEPPTNRPGIVENPEKNLECEIVTDSTQPRSRGNRL